MRLLLLMALLSACGASEIGEECEGVGSMEDCVDGAICDTVDGVPICLPLCADDDDCYPNEKCEGVSHSNLKACHPD